MLDKALKILKENIKYIILFIVLVFVFTFELPYNIMMPGGLIDISDRVSTDNSTPDINGSLNLLYVSQTHATIPGAILSKFIDGWDMEKSAEEKVGDESDYEVNVRNKALLNNSIKNATYVAYTHASKDIRIIGYENVIIGVTDKNQSDLKIGDIVLEYNDQELQSTNLLKEVIANYNVGDIIKFKVKREDKILTIDCPVVEVDGAKQIGVLMITNYQYELSPQVETSFTPSESGASGGLMLTLSIYDIISEEDLVKGRNIAGTGAIDINGNVEEIAGVKYKIMGIGNKNIDVVFVPTSNYEEAIKVNNEYNYNLNIVAVNTFDEAVEYLQNN